MIHVDLKSVGAYLTETSAWGKAFADFTEAEILGLCEVILEATAADEGVVKPYIDPAGNLVIPFRAPRKYRWWQDGQSISDTLAEMNAPFEVARRHINIENRPGLGLTEEEWARRLTPF